MSHAEDDGTLPKEKVAEDLYKFHAPDNQDWDDLRDIETALSAANRALDFEDLEASKGWYPSWEPVLPKGAAPGNERLMPTLRDTHGNVVSHPYFTRGDPKMTILIKFAPVRWWAVTPSEIANRDNAGLTRDSSMVVGFDKSGNNVRNLEIMERWVTTELAEQLAKWKSGDGARYGSDAKQIEAWIRDPDSKKIHNLMPESSNPDYPSSLKGRAKIFTQANKGASLTSILESSSLNRLPEEDAERVKKVLRDSNGSLKYQPVSIRMPDGITEAEPHRLRHGAIAAGVLNVFGLATSGTKGGATIARRLDTVFLAFNGPETSGGSTGVNVLEALQKKRAAASEESTSVNVIDQFAAKRAAKKAKKKATNDG